MLNKIITLIKEKENIFLTGGAGVGKTTLTRATIESLENDGKKVAKLASTAMAATLIEGQTLHSFFDFGLSSNEEELSQNNKLDLKKKVKKLIASMDLIIIDEISMVSRNLLDLVRFRLLQAEFNGSLMVVGDFLQLPPVIKNAPLSFAFESTSWEKFNFKNITLSKIYRTDDLEFIDVLNKVRFAQVEDKEHLYLHNLIKEVGDDKSKYTFLFGKNSSADLHNIQMLEQLETKEYRFKTLVTLHEKNIYDKEVERFQKDSKIPDELVIKLDAPVIFTRNSWNYYNGQKGTIIKVDKDQIYVLSDDKKVIKLEKVKLSKNIWKERTKDKKKVLLEEPRITLEQFPLTLAYAITIHKSQGMSMHDLVIDTHEIFAPSQFYVALSRSITPKRLALVQPKVNWKHLAFVNPKALEFTKKSLSN